MISSFTIFKPFYFPKLYLVFLCYYVAFLHSNKIIGFPFQETLFDEFVPAHLFGWWGKAIMIRNQPLLWVLSIGFELMEVRL